MTTSLMSTYKGYIVLNNRLCTDFVEIHFVVANDQQSNLMGDCS